LRQLFSKKNLILSTALSATIVLLFVYQNCSKTTFSSVPSTNAGVTGLGTPGNSIAEVPQCIFNGRVLGEGQTVLAYQNSSVQLGQQCRYEFRKCSQGSLSGTFSFAQCGVAQPEACLFNGRTINHGDSVLAYSQSNVAYGQVCKAEKRTCQNGSLQGPSYNFETCTVNEAAACVFTADQILQSGQSIWAYEASSVPYGSTCSKQMRQCNDGALSGTYKYATCSPGAPAKCLFSGRELAHEEVVQAYNESCDKQERICKNGTLSGSGSYSFSSCNQPPPEFTISCANVSNLVGDMSVLYTKIATGRYELIFGTFADNYWTNGQYDRKLVFKIDNINLLNDFVLSQAAYDDWQWIKINDQTVYVGPVSAERRMSQTNGFVELQNSYVRTDAGNFPAELSTSWDFYPQINIKSYLKQGFNTIWTRTIVDGGGENALRFNLGLRCSN